MIKTTSQLLNHHKSIEEQQSKYYEKLAREYNDRGDVFNSLAKENLRHLEMAQRAYREGVTDAFEVGFLANLLDPQDYKLTEPTGGFEKAMKIMISNEETVIRFCLDAASNSSKLLPDVPETFERLVKRKKKSIEKMREIE